MGRDHSHFSQLNYVLLQGSYGFLFIRLYEPTAVLLLQTNTSLILDWRSV